MTVGVRRRPTWSRLAILLGSVLSLALPLASPPASDAALPGLLSAVPESVPGEVVVRFRSSADRVDRAAVRSSLDLELGLRMPIPAMEQVELPRGVSIAQGIRVLERRAEVKYAEPNYLYHLDAKVPDDQYFFAQYGLDNTGQAPFSGSPDADVDAPEAWDGTTGSSSVTVAVADSGIDFSHPDLAVNLRTTGYDFVDDDADPSDPLAAGPAQAHGTEVAGVIGADGNNGKVTTGVNWQVGIEPIRACDDTQCSSSAIVSAMYYARNQGVPVFNGSFGGPIFSQAMKEAIDASPNVLFVFSAGNDARNNDLLPAYPCVFDSPNIICVAATDEFDSLWLDPGLPPSGSNYGASSVDLAAPGRQILTTFPPSLSNNPYSVATGTSFAAPFVSGAAALVLSTSPGASPAQLKAKILGGVDHLASLTGKVSTGGRLNLDHIVPDPPDPPPQPRGTDTSPPSTGITRGPERRTFKVKATFTFISNERGSTFGCALDRARVRPCTSPKTFQRIKPGRHRLAVQASDSAGNTDPTPALYRWRIKRR